MASEFILGSQRDTGEVNEHRGRERTSTHSNYNDEQISELSSLISKLEEDQEDIILHTRIRGFTIFHNYTKKTSLSFSILF